MPPHNATRSIDTFATNAHDPDEVCGTKLGAHMHNEPAEPPVFQLWSDEHASEES